MLTDLCGDWHPADWDDYDRDYEPHCPFATNNKDTQTHIMHMQKTCCGQVWSDGQVLSLKAVSVTDVL